MEEEEARRTREVTLPRPLAGLSIDELTDYVARLRTEIGRVEAEIDRQRAIKGAADALFKRPAG